MDNFRDTGKYLRARNLLTSSRIILDNNIDNPLLLENTELNRRIVLLEKTLLEKARTREALEDSEKRYRRLFESAKDGILILDADTGKVVDVNPFLLQLLGYSYNALYGQYIWELGVFKDIAASKDAFQTLQDNEYIRYDDLPLETHDGKPIAVEFVSNVYLVDHSRVIQCNIRDITARKQVDAERKQLMAAVEQSGEVIFMTDAKGIIQYANPAFKRTTGYSRKEIEGQTPRILKSGEQDEPFYYNLWDTIGLPATDLFFLDKRTFVKLSKSSFKFLPGIHDNWATPGNRFAELSAGNK